jgi:hypothetical protein
MDAIKPPPTGWMKLALRAQVCTQCHAEGEAPNTEPRPCEPACAYFVQLPRLALFLKRYRCRPPAGYEEDVINLLQKSATKSHLEGALEYAWEALATLESVAKLIEPPTPSAGGDCIRRDLALAQLQIDSQGSIEQ